VRIIELSDIVKRDRLTAWEFQQTFRTPLKDLPRFVDVIMSALAGIERATVAFDQVVFDPRYELVLLYKKYSLPQKWYGDGLTIEAQSATEARELLQAVLSEWIDFLCVPFPDAFVIYADHDEYITFLAHRKGQLAALVELLTGAGFQPVEYIRRL
jgi:hypothetical protein